MDRLQQKCFVGSAGFHLLLFVILLVGPAFLAPKSRVDTSPILDVIPTKLIDAAFSGGGNPNGTPPPPAPPVPPPPTPPPPAPPPEPVKAKPPEPTPEPVKEVKPAPPDPNALEPDTKPQRKLPNVSTKPIVRRTDTAKTTKTAKTADTPSEEDLQAQRYADARKRAAAVIGASARSLRDDIAPGTSVEPVGPGGRGEVYASYDQAVRSAYWQAWRPPQDTASDNAITRATVTIASDGSVLSARIIQPSGDASVDKSVRETLDRVTYIAPFPQGAKDKQRTYTIRFDLKARRLTQ